jgi:hypothetical protein
VNTYNTRIRQLPGNSSWQTAGAEAAGVFQVSDEDRKLVEVKLD